MKTVLTADITSHTAQTVSAYTPPAPLTRPVPPCAVRSARPPGKEVMPIYPSNPQNQMKRRTNEQNNHTPPQTAYIAALRIAAFALLLKNNHLPHIRFHELRHSCASLLLNSGFTLKDVQEYMGHSDIQMTANIYGHLDTQRKNLLTEKITASIF